jgi:methyl halide transferase
MGTDWEAHYQTGDMPWEKGAPCPGLVEFLQGNPPLSGKILVPGCGWGHDVRAISNSRNEVTGFDIAPSAIEGTQKFSRTGNETYLHGDLFALPPELRGVFDWVWEHTCFCAIDPAMRSAYVQSVAAALKPGGHLLAIFYLNPDHDDGPPFGVTTAELDAFFSDAFDLVREWPPGSAYPGREGRERMRLLRRRE